MLGKSGSIAAVVFAALLLLVSCAEQAREQRPQPPPPQSQPAAEPSQPAPVPPKPEPQSAATPTEVPAEPVAAAKKDVAAGKAVYEKKCANCHGTEGEGKAAIARMFKVELRDLGSAAVQGKSDEQLRKDIMQGIGKMTPTKGLDDTHLVNLVAFLRTLK